MSPSELNVTCRLTHFLLFCLSPAGTLSVHSILKEYLIFAALLVLSVVSWQWSASYSGRQVLIARQAPAMLPVAYQPAGLALPSAVLPRSCRVLIAPQAGHVEQMYVSEGQTVRPGDLLLKLAVGHDNNTKTVFVLAPGAGEVIGVGVSPGAYLPLGAAYARLTRSCPVQEQGAASAVAQLAVGN